MAGLILEGGSLRPIFSAGAMDALLDNKLYFDYVIGVSAGITNATSYVSRQPRRNLEVLERFRNDKRYFSARNMLSCRSPFGLDFLFDRIPNELIPYDWQALAQFDGQIKIGATDAQTGQITYFDGKQMDRKCTLLRATCAIPLTFPAVNINGRAYFDGGIADSVPIAQSLADGNHKNLVVLTQPQGYRKTQGKTARMAATWYQHKYPALSQSLHTRPQRYNQTMELLEQMERTQPNDIVVLRPKHRLRSLESDINVLTASYEHGYQMALDNLEQIRALLLK